MPSLDFELPHWAYWSMLGVFPLVAMLLAHRGRATGYSLPLGYFILLTGGMLGLHRFYLRSIWGLLFLPLFLGILFANSEERAAREVQSEAANGVRTAERVVARNAPRLEGAAARLEELRAAAAEATETGTRIQQIRAERALEREEARIDEAREAVADAEATLATGRPALEDATAAREFWSDAAFALFCAILAFMAVDALLLPGLRRRAEAAAAAEDPTSTDVEHAIETVEAEETKRDEDHIGRGPFGSIDRLSFYAGEFVSYWAVIAVFVYYYEVVARYVFNSPTNWAHEGMFLMFGMQYLIAGAYAALTEAHVRVDIFYARWSPLGKAWVDLLTSVFFFIFAGTLLVTGWIFAMDATRVGELSFSEWQIAYWPFKWAIVVGGALLVLQGVAKLGRDIATIRNAREA
ncbi:MAG: TRAP transporter small permease subunit [Paracoccaceae bacterium]